MSGNEELLPPQDKNELQRYEHMGAMALTAINHAQRILDVISQETFNPTKRSVGTIFMLKGQARMFTQSALAILELM